MQGFIAQFKAFLAKPYSSSNNAGQWFAFIGLLLVSVYLWHTIARDFGHMATLED